jgi:uncharacterized phage protein gp47/JayE
MPFARPTLTEIIDRVVFDISSRITGVDGAVLRRSLIGILGRAEAGSVHLLYGYLDWIAKQVMPDTAETEFLERWCAIWKVTRKPASFATGQVTFTTAVGSVITAGAVVQRQDGLQYEVLTEVTSSGSTVAADVQALTAGAASNTAAGVIVSLLSPIAGVQANAVVASGGLTAGADVEEDDDLRARLIRRIQEPPQGGAAADYITWALEVPGVTRAWVYPLLMGPGTVTVTFVADNNDPIIPSPELVEDVEEHIDVKRPVTAHVFVVAPTADALDMTIKISPNTADVRAAVTAEVSDLITRTAQPGGTIYISKIREAVSIAAGENNNQVVTPTADVVSATGHMPVLGTITFESL